MTTGRINCLKTHFRANDALLFVAQLQRAQSITLIGCAWTKKVDTRFGQVRQRCPHELPRDNSCLKKALPVESLGLRKAPQNSESPTRNENFESPRILVIQLLSFCPRCCNWTLLTFAFHVLCNAKKSCQCQLRASTSTATKHCQDNTNIRQKTLESKKVWLSECNVFLQALSNSYGLSRSREVPHMSAQVM